MNQTFANPPITDLPTPLAASVFAMASCALGLRPDYTEAVSRLIDSAEMITQLGCFSALALVGRSQLPSGSATDAALAVLPGTFLQVPLSTGHYLAAWRLCDAALRQPGASVPPAFVVIKDLLSVLELQHVSALTTLDDIPELRNRRKGHSFTLPQGQAEQLWKEWFPKLSDLLAALQPCYQSMRFAVITDTADDGLAELRCLHGNLTLSQCTPFVVTSDRKLSADDIVLVPQLALARQRVLEHEVLPLSPLMRMHADKVFLYQGRRGKKFMYLASDASEDSQSANLESQFRTAYPTSFAKQSIEVPRMPKWAESLASVDYLCVSEISRLKPNPGGFFRGTPCTWADIREELDAPRRLSISSQTFGMSEFLSGPFSMLLDAAKRFESPLFILQGPAGSGKTTCLARIAFDAWEALSPKIAVVRALPGVAPTFSDLRLVCTEAKADVVCLVCDEFSRYDEQLAAIRRRASHDQIPLLILAADRSYFIEHAGSMLATLLPLSDEEIAQLVGRLDKHGQLGLLASLESHDRIEFVRGKLDRQVLVALREATAGKRFDEILRDEFERIPSDKGKNLYAAICMVHSSDASIPEVVAMALLGTTVRADFSRILHDLLDVVVRVKQPYGRALVARHRLIADFIAKEVSGNSDELYDQMYEVIAAYQASLKLLREECGELADCGRLLASSLGRRLLTDSDNRKGLATLLAGFHSRIGIVIAGFMSACDLESSEEAALFGAAVVEAMAGSHFACAPSIAARIGTTLAKQKKLDEAVRILQRSYDDHKEQPAAQAILLQPLAMCRIERREPLQALEVVREVVRRLEIGDQSGPLVNAVLSSFEPLCQLGRAKEACEIGMRAVGPAFADSPRQGATLVAKIAKTLRERGLFEDCISLVEQWLSNIPEGEQPETFGQCAEQACKAACEVGELRGLAVVQSLQVRCQGVGVRELARFVRLSKDGALVGNTGVAAFLASFESANDRLQIAYSSFTQQAKQEASCELVNGEVLAKWLRGCTKISSLEFVIRLWLGLHRTNYPAISPRNAEMTALAELIPELDINSIWLEIRDGQSVQ